MMFSVQYVTTCMNSIDFSTSVQYIIEFLTFDIIGQTRSLIGEYRCEKFGRIFHM